MTRLKDNEYVDDYGNINEVKDIRVNIEKGTVKMTIKNNLDSKTSNHYLSLKNAIRKNLIDIKATSKLKK